ncbi:BPTD_3080 family restriction endonuclease [Lamprocystis purpurea]|uniref:BPTD_3080 family restriction endonuclease n=1 Tax=Lamprocystis purpurea TaxID=61598 RepID=UPI00037A5D5F|nr:DEAD/DEAH box helicase family protein [Lamprocystis purpurea]
MSNPFFDRPILNSPYAYPARHWELDDTGQPTQKIVEARRRAEFITPIPKPKKQKGVPKQGELLFDDGKGLSTEAQRYDHTAIINAVRQEVDRWRLDPDPNHWRVTPETARLLTHWRQHPFSSLRPFFCQIEAVETAIWLTEVAPQIGKAGERFLTHLTDANHDANPELLRLALKLATGAGKTTVMAMLIAWQTVNAVRRPGSKKFTRGFLIVAPGLTIKDRLRVLQPNDPDSYYASRELVPGDLLDDVRRAKIVITNYHAFRRRERIELSKGGRLLLQGRGGDALDTLETEGQMLQRVMPDLMGLKNILGVNDEAHHCYREKPGRDQGGDLEGDLKGDEKKEAEKNNAAARLWISGLEAVNRNLGLARVFDLSATPFFLRGSGYAEGTLFPWTLSDFSLMDAIECGIVKLPRVPVADNIPGGEMPMFRNLWEHIRAKMPKKGRGKSESLNPLDLPTQLQTALEALYGHYEKTFALWQQAGVASPPCFIVVCNNTSASKLVYDYIAGFDRTKQDGTTELVPGRLPLFRNHDEHGNALPRPRTLLIDSEQLESGEALDDHFRAMAADEIERFRREILERGGQLADELLKGKDLDDVALLREVMNTVGKPGRLGADIRCVVSVSMLTEGWDANTVTHVLGVRAFGTQLLCEQVIGRALRRQSYDLNEDGLFNVEYADVLGIPFDFNAKPVVAPPQPPRETIQVKAVRPERDALEIRFPRVAGYRTELPQERLTAEFNDDSVLELTPDLIGATRTQNAGIIGATVDLDLVHTGDVRPSQMVYELTSYLVLNKWRDANDEPRLNLFGQLKRIARQWLDGYLVCKGGTFPAQLKYKMLADMACERITAGITRAFIGKRPILALLDPYNPVGSTAHVRFNTSKTERWETDSRRCHINWVILDSDWEAEFCRVAEAHPRVRAYAKNHSLGFEVPYRYGSAMRRYLPDFVLLVDDGHGEDDLLHLTVEIKGYRREDAKEKKSTMDTYWVPGVNNLGTFGRWAFAEFTEVYQIEADFKAKVESEFNKMIETVAPIPATREASR